MAEAPDSVIDGYEKDIPENVRNYRETKEDMKEIEELIRQVGEGEVGISEENRELGRRVMFGFNNKMLTKRNRESILQSIAKNEMIEEKS